MFGVRIARTTRFGPIVASTPVFVIPGVLATPSSQAKAIANKAHGTTATLMRCSTRVSATAPTFGISKPRMPSTKVSTGLQQISPCSTRRNVAIITDHDAMPLAQKKMKTVAIKRLLDTRSSKVSDSSTDDAIEKVGTGGATATTRKATFVSR